MSDNEQKNIPPATPENAAADSPAAATPTRRKLRARLRRRTPTLPPPPLPPTHRHRHRGGGDNERQKRIVFGGGFSRRRFQNTVADGGIHFRGFRFHFGGRVCNHWFGGCRFFGFVFAVFGFQTGIQTAAKANATKSDSDSAAAKVAASSDSKKADAKSSPAKPAAAKKAAAATPPKKVVKVRRRLRGVVSGNRADKNRAGAGDAPNQASGVSKVCPPATTMCRRTTKTTPAKWATR